MNPAKIGPSSFKTAGSVEVTVIEKMESERTVDSVSVGPQLLVLSKEGSSEGAVDSLPLDLNSNKWRPIFLHRATILAFLVFFLLQCIALIALFSYSEQHGGIVPVAAKYHQAWKYGPNAIIAITIVLWAQVELHAKKVTVWAAFLSEKNANSESDSLKTDYLSKLNIVALLDSLRRRHWIVSLSILATLLLQLTAVVSTSLLEREIQPYSYQINGLRTSAVFSSQALVTNESFAAMEAVVDLASGFYKGVEFTYPFGTTDSLAFQPLELPVAIQGVDDYRVEGSKSFITANVQYLRPRITCSPVADRFALELPLEYGLNSLQSGGLNRNLSLSANITGTKYVDPDDPEGETVMNTIYSNLTMHHHNWTITDLPVEWNPGTTVSLTKDGCEIILSAYATHCGPSKTDIIHLYFPMSSGLQDCDDTDLVLLTSFCEAADRSIFNMTITMLECTPNDRYGKATVKLENTSDNPPLEITELEGLSDREQPYGNRLLDSVLTVTDNTAGGGLSYIVVNISESAGQDITDARSAKKALESYYPFLAVQLFRVTSFTSGNETTSGTINTQISRLTVKSVSFWTMATTLTIISAACGGVLILAASQPMCLSTLRDPSALAGTIILLQSHPRLGDIIHEMSKSLGWYQTKTQRQKWWRPWGTTKTTIWASIGALIAAIAVLQATHAISTSARGLVLVTVDGWVSYGWTLVPTLLVAGLGLAVSSIDINLRTIGPFAILTQGHPASAHALFEDYLFGLLPSLLWALARNRRTRLATVTIGAMLMPFTMLVIGDLFVMSSEPSKTEHFGLLQSDGFDETTMQNWTSPFGGPWSPSQPGSELYNTAPLPKFATDTFTMEAYALPDPPRAQHLTGNSVVLTGIVTTGKINCTFVETECKESRRPSFLNPSTSVPCNERSFSGNFRLSQYDGCPPSLLRTIRPVSFCYEPGADRTSDELTGEQWEQARVYELSSGISSRSEMTSLRGQFDSYKVTNTSNFVPNDDCPVLLDYGEEVIGNCALSRRTVAVCYPYLQVSEADVRLSLPDLKVEDVFQTPTQLSSVRSHRVYGMGRYVGLWQWRNFKANEMRVPTGWDDITAAFRDILLVSEIANSTVSVDHFRATDSGSRAKVLAALETRWARVVAQIIRRNESSSIVEFDPPQVVHATLVDYGKRRLVQTEVSTRILQAVLGWTALCLIAGLFFGNGDLDQVLPEPPTSIGAVVRLLARSKILGSVKRKEEGNTEDENEQGEMRQDDDIILPVPQEKTGQRVEEDVHRGEAQRDQISPGGPRNLGETAPIRVDSGLKWRKRLIPAGTGNISDRELMVIFAVPGRIYCLKEWDKGDERLGFKRDAVSRGGKNNNGAEDGILEKNKWYGIDFEERG